jgi:hypothetical protein
VNTFKLNVLGFLSFAFATLIAIDLILGYENATKAVPFICGLSLLGMWVGIQNELHNINK